MHAGAGVYRPTVDNDLCESWREEAKRICNTGKTDLDPGETQRNFNKRFYNNLNNRNPGMANQFDPEILVGVQQGGTLTVLEQAAANPSAAFHAEANALILTWVGLGCQYLEGGIGGKGMCSALNQRVKGLFGAGASPIHADGMLRDGTAVEIKGPGDKPGDGQFDKEQKCAKNGKLLVIDGKACDPNNEILTPSGGCPKGKK